MKVFLLHVIGLLIINQVSTLVGMTKSILFASKFKKKNIKKLNTKYGDMQIKQHFKVKCLRCLMDEGMFGETMSLNVIHKLNNKLKLLYCKNVF